MGTELETKPIPRFPEGVTPDRNELAGKRYGTNDMCRILGADRTVAAQLQVQGLASKTYSDLHPDIIPPEHANQIVERATI